MKISDLPINNDDAHRQVAELLVLGFEENWPNAWPDLDSALKEVKLSLGDDRISRIAVNDEGQIVGWIGGISQYGGHTWELHPLVVHPDYQGRGIGRDLVKDLEKQVRSRGGTTIWLGSDDENEMTSLAGIDLYPDVLKWAAEITNLKAHPYTFYQKQGFAVVGVLPDANGPGKPDIFMAKTVRRDLAAVLK